MTFELTFENFMCDTLLRRQTEALLTLLEAFVYDPLVDWTSGTINLSRSSVGYFWDAECCRVLQGVVGCRGVLQGVAGCCSVSQCVAVCCSVLQCVAVCCPCGKCVQIVSKSLCRCSLLQCVAVCCSVLRCVALCSRYNKCGQMVSRLLLKRFLLVSFGFYGSLLIYMAYLRYRKCVTHIHTHTHS